jgi:uncharacterized protein YeaO (DUF488 family)
MDIRVKRIYAQASDDDGYRVLVDRLWPRGISKASAKLDHWARDLSPSNELRQWYGHDPAKWDGFRRRYRAEIKEMHEQMEALRERGREARVTLLFGSTELHFNNAHALREILLEG